MNKMFVVLDKKEINEEEQSIVAWGSKPVIDRDKELIKGEAWDLKEFRKNPVLMLSHDYRQPPIGKVLWARKNKEGLKFKAQFAKTQIAEEVFQLYKDDIMRAFSVGFIPKKWREPKEKEGNGENPRRIYTNVELLEISCVSIPSCPDALMEAHDNGKIKTKELNDILEVIKTGDKAKYPCECIKCGWKVTSDKHCKDLKCKECGGQMRRVERPGPGQEGETEEENECKELVIKPEETDDFIRIPVRDCKVTATITISADQGITALYCGKIKKIRTYIFSKKEPYKWTMKRALAWVEKHGKSIQIEETEDASGKLGLYIVCEGMDFTVDLGIEDEELKETYKKYDKIADENWAKWTEEVQPQLIEKIEALSEENKELRNDNRELRSEIRELKKELKEGRVLSAKTRKAVQTALGGMETAIPPLTTLLTENESPKEEQMDLSFIKENPKKENKVDVDMDGLTRMIEKSIVEWFGKIKTKPTNYTKVIQEMIDKARGKVS